MVKIVNKRHSKYDVYIGRGSIYGNPYVIGVHGTRDEVIDKYEKYFNEKVSKDEKFRESVLSLDGLIIGCFCKRTEIVFQKLLKMCNIKYEILPTSLG